MIESCRHISINNAAREAAYRLAGGGRCSNRRADIGPELRGGHSAIEVTMTIYALVSLDEKRNAMLKLGEALN